MMQNEVYALPEIETLFTERWFHECFFSANFGLYSCDVSSLIAATSLIKLRSNKVSLTSYGVWTLAEH